MEVESENKTITTGRRLFDTIDYVNGEWVLDSANFTEVFMQRMYALGKINFQQGRNEPSDCSRRLCRQ